MGRKWKAYKRLKAVKKKVDYNDPPATVVNIYESVSQPKLMCILLNVLMNCMVKPLLQKRNSRPNPRQLVQTYSIYSLASCRRVRVLHLCCFLSSSKAFFLGMAAALATSKRGQGVLLIVLPPRGEHWVTFAKLNKDRQWLSIKCFHIMLSKHESCLFYRSLSCVSFMILGTSLTGFLLC